MMSVELIEPDQDELTIEPYTDELAIQTKRVCCRWTGSRWIKTKKYYKILVIIYKLKNVEDDESFSLFSWKIRKIMIVIFSIYLNQTNFPSSWITFVSSTIILEHSKKSPKDFSYQVLDIFLRHLDQLVIAQNQEPKECCAV